MEYIAYPRVLRGRRGLERSEAAVRVSVAAMEEMHEQFLENIITGVVPVVPTVFTEDEDLDLDGQRRVIDFLIDAKADGACILANYSEQFSLTDEERDQILTTSLAHAAGRIPVCVTTSHYSARIARQRTLQAQREGAAMVMLMAPFFGATVRVNEVFLAGSRFAGVSSFCSALARYQQQTDQ